MRKSMWLMAALWCSIFISGCGGSQAVNVVASAPTALVVADVANKIFYSTPTNSTTGYIAFHIFSDGTATWDSTANTDAVPMADVSGTWGISASGQLILSSAGKTAYQFNCVQKESNYWLMADASNNITRFYRDQVEAQAYLDSISFSTTNGNGTRMGGVIQGIPLPAFNNISTVVGVTGQGANPFADYTSAAGKTPPVQLGRPVGITTIDGVTFFVLDSLSNRIQVVTFDKNGGSVIKVKTLGSASTPSVDLTFNNPSDITNDGTNLYVTDTSNYTIDKIALATDSNNNYTGALTILAGSTGASQAYDGTGNTPANGATAGTTGAARFLAPVGITTDGTNLYVTDANSIRKIDIGSSTATPQVTTLAGYPSQAGTADGTGTAAHFNLPVRLTTDGTNLYVADYNNYTIRKVAIATGQVTTIAGSPGNFGTNSTPAPTGEKAFFNGPQGITTDGTNLYVTDWGPVVYGAPVRGQVIFSVSLALVPSTLNPGSYTSSAVTKIAGTQNTIGTGSNQPSTSDPNSALFNSPTGITTDGVGLYVADSNNYTIRRIMKR